MRLLRRVGAGERNGAPVGRHRRGLPESRPRDERTDRPTRDVQRVDARYLVLPVPGGVLQAVESGTTMTKLIALPSGDHFASLGFSATRVIWEDAPSASIQRTKIWVPLGSPSAR